MIWKVKSEKALNGWYDSIKIFEYYIFVVGLNINKMMNEIIWDLGKVTNSALNLKESFCSRLLRLK